MDNFHITVSVLSAPQVHALLDHMHAKCAGSHSFLSAIRHSTTLIRMESFLKNGPTKLLQSFFDRLPDHQIDIERSSTHPMDLEMEVNHFSRILQTCLVDMTLNPALTLDFNCGVEGVPTFDLTKDDIKVCYLPLRGNIAEDLEEDLGMLAPAPGSSTHQPAIHDVSSKAPIPPADEERLSPQPLGRLEALMSKENRTLTLMKVGTEEASSCFDVPASRDEASYDGDVSDAGEDDIEVIPDEVGDALAGSSGPVKATSAVAREVQKTLDKSDGSQTSKSAGKNKAHQHNNKASSHQGTQGQVSKGPHFCALYPVGWLSPSYELLQYATKGTEDVEHILSYRHNSGRWINPTRW